MLFVRILLALVAARSGPFSDAAAIAMLEDASCLMHQLRPGDDSTTCSIKDQAVTNAIGKFCSNPVPNVQKEGTVRVLSDKKWTLEGIKWGVQILWECGESPGKGEGQGSSAGEVLEEMCLSTWWNMCAHHGEQGCQEWSTFSVVHLLKSQLIVFSMNQRCQPCIKDGWAATSCTWARFFRPAASVRSSKVRGSLQLRHVSARLSFFTKAPCCQGGHP